MNAYCLFCQTQKARVVAMALETRGIHRAFTPQIIQRRRVRGELRDLQFNMLPGYVFVYDESTPDFKQVLSGITGLVRRLGEPEAWFRLHGSDMDFAMRLYEKDGFIGEMTLFREGDEVHVEDELFKGCNGVVTRVDYKKQRARVEFDFAGSRCAAWVAFEMIDKKDAGDGGE